jgi:hypothetical protein
MVLNQNSQKQLDKQRMVTLSQAERLIKLARESIISYFNNKEPKVDDKLKKEFEEERGVFVSLYVDDELVGCIGYPEPVLPLWKAVKEAAKAAAFDDPRFPPLSKEQYKGLRVEISVLTKPELIKVKNASEYPSKVKVGVDGLIIRDPYGSGLLLPQVATEYNWDSKEFLCETCVKAGLDRDCWKDGRRHVYKFQAEVFTEEKGKVVKKKL